MMARWMRWIVCGCASATLAVLMASGCDTQDGDTDGEETESATDSETGSDSEGVGGCGATMTSVVSDLNASIPDFASTPAEVLETIQGAKAGTFSWQQNGDFVSTPHDGTSSPLAFELTAGSEVRLIEVENHGDFPNGQEGGAPCSNTLELDANLTFTTEDGVFTLSESTVITVTAFDFSDAPGAPSLYHAINFANHAGTLTQADFTVGEGSVSNAILTGTFNAGAIDGGLLVEVDDGDFVGAGNVGSFDAS